MKQRAGFILLLLFSLPLQSQDYRAADSIAHALRGHSMSNLRQLSLNLSKDLNTDKEKFRALHTWVCENISVDYRLFRKIERQRRKLKGDSLALIEWNKEVRPKILGRLFEERKTVCTGYAFLLAQMAQNIGIDCRVVNGYGRIGNSNIHQLESLNHSWNAVKLEGKWQFCDPTWSSGIIHVNGALGFFEASYNDGYLLCPKPYFHLSHWPENRFWLDQSLEADQNFTEAPLCYGGAYKVGLFPAASEKLERHLFKGEVLTFYFDQLGDFKSADFYLQIDNGFSSRELKLEQKQLVDGKLVLQHQFEKSGLYDAHIFLGKDLLASYQISVSRP